MSAGYMEALVQLKASLPPIHSLTESEDAEEQVRAALACLVEQAISTQEMAISEPRPSDPSACPNCGAPSNSLRSPYCSEHCREMSAFVRQLRNGIATGTILEKDRQVGMGQALWKLRGGGYPVRQRLVTPRTLAQVIARHGGVCSVCGGPATEVDHTGSG